MSSTDHVSRVRRYYEKNTHRFLRFGQGGFAGAIHRSVWAPTVTSEREAFAYADELIRRRIVAEKPGPDFHVLDLGCGVGASLQYLAERAGLRGTGITISPVQVRLAKERLASSGARDRVRVVEGSYLDIPAGVGTANAAFSIEAFLMCPEPARFFQQVRDHLVPRGLLMILDDFAAERAVGDSSKQTRRIFDEFKEGWITSRLLSLSQVAALAAQHGFVLEENTDLTPYLECGRVRDRLIAAFVVAARHFPMKTEYVKNFIGGNALQQGIRRNIIEYRFLVFRKAGG